MNKEIEETRKRKADIETQKKYASAMAERMKADGYTFAFVITKQETMTFSRRYWGHSLLLCDVLGGLVTEIAGYFAKGMAARTRQLNEMGIEDPDVQVFEESNPG